MRVLIPLAEGFEEMEGVILLDVLRRARIETVAAAMGDTREVPAARGVTVVADTTWSAVDPSRFDLIAIPGGMGALLARRQLAGGGGGDGEEEDASYVGELFLMAAGALFFALNVAPTEEVILIAYKATPWHALALIVASVALLHVIVFEAGFAGQEEADHPLKAFAHFTMPGYAIALGISLFALFLFGRVEGHSLEGLTQTVLVLGFPASVGAAAARLLV